MSQTEAFLSIVPSSYINSRLVGYFGKIRVEDHKELLDQLQAEEKKHPYHWVVYHGGNAFMGSFYDLFKEVSVLLDQPCLSVAFRNNSDLNNMYVPEYLAKYQYNINDHVIPHKTDLLSVNLSVFGHLRSHESAFYYFQKNHSWEIPQTLLQSMLGEFDQRLVQQKALLMYVDFELKRISALLDAEEGYLAQIFIPHDSVDKFLYLSRPGGRMWTHKIVYADGRKHEEGFDVDYGYTNIAPLLKIYVERPELLSKSIYKMQARMLLHKDFLNAESGIIMKRYMLSSAKAFMCYEQEIKKLAQDIVVLINSPIVDSHVLQTTLEKRMQKNDWPVRCYRLNEQTLQQAWVGLKDEDFRVKLSAFDLFRTLISQNECSADEGLRAIHHGLRDENVRVQDKAFKLMRFLAQKNYCIPEITMEASQRVKSNYWYKRLYGLKLYYDIIKNNCVPDVIPEVYDVAIAACHDEEPEIRFFVVDVFKILLEKQYLVNHKNILEKLDHLTSDEDSRVCRVAIEAWELVNKGHDLIS